MKNVAKVGLIISDDPERYEEGQPRIQDREKQKRRRSEGNRDPSAMRVFMLCTRFSHINLNMTVIFLQVKVVYLMLPISYKSIFFADRKSIPRHTPRYAIIIVLVISQSQTAKHPQTLMRACRTPCRSRRE